MVIMKTVIMVIMMMVMMIDDGDYEDATLQQRASRGPAPIQVIITRRPRPKVSYVSLLKDNNSQPQESKV